MGVWANYAVLDEVTRGEGTVVPSSRTQVIQNLEGGILADILVHEGDIVEAGDVLVRIENTIAQANLQDARSQYLTLQATEARLMAERSEENTSEIQSLMRKSYDVICLKKKTNKMQNYNPNYE